MIIRWTAIALSVIISAALTATAVTGDDREEVYMTFDNNTNIDQLLAKGSISAADPSWVVKTTRLQVKRGDQALLVGGRIRGEQFANVRINIKLKDLMNAGVIDFSDKMLKVSVFVPQGSVIDHLAVGLWRDDDYVCMGSKKIEQGAWNDLTFFLKHIFAARLWEFTHTWLEGDRNLSIKEAEEAIKACTVLEIKGQRNLKGGDKPAEFYIDDLSWLTVTRDNDPTIVADDDSTPSLRDYAEQRNLKIGAAVDSYSLLSDGRYLRNLALEYNCIVPEYELKWFVLQPEEGVFDFTRADFLIQFAQNNNLGVRGHTLVWHACYNHKMGYDMFVPQWLEKKSYGQLKGYMEDYIEKIMSHYRGKIFAWEVFNEVVKDDGTGLRNNKENPNGWDYSIWAAGPADDSLVKAAFFKARQVDPNTKLFLNDYDNEEINNPKAEKFYQLVKNWLEQGVPIDGVGFQLHITEERGLNMPKFRANLDRFTALGLEIHFTEVDVRVKIKDLNLHTPQGKKTLEKRLAHQAEIYAELMKIALDYENITAFITWGFTDRYSPVGATFPGYAYALPFAENYDKKPAYHALMAVLKTHK